VADVTSPFGFPYPEDDDFVRDGAQDIENLATGVNDYLTGGFLYAGTRYFFSDGSFAKADPLLTGDIGLRAIRVRLVGGGGGGGGSASTGGGQVSMGGCGGGAGYAEKLITNIAGLSTSETITRGSGGNGGSPGDNAGSAGGSSTAFGSTADGGGGGAGGAALALASQVPGAGGVSGAGGSADLIKRGEGGPIQFATSTSRIFRFGGGSSAFSFINVAGGVAGGSGAGEAAASNAFGCGGGGGFCIENTGTGRAGAAGANGLIAIDCFI
jgi:hypothetical protein